MDPLSTGAPTPAHGSPSSAPLTPAQRAAQQQAASRVAGMFMLQLQQASSNIGTFSDDPNDPDANQSSGLGLDPNLMALSSLLPALGMLGGSFDIRSAMQALSGAKDLGTTGVGGNAQAAGCAMHGAHHVASARGGGSGNAGIVADEARKAGVDPALAVAMMLAESGGNARAVGDGGTSFGLFQLHKGGMLTAAGLTPDQAFDPRTNAAVAIRSLAAEYRKGPNRSPGDIAAASQRPADRVGYAAKVNALLPRARALLGQ